MTISFFGMIIVSAHRIHRVESFEIVAAYTLRVRFDDESEQTIDFSTVLACKLFGPLRNLDLFNEVRIDPEVQDVSLAQRSRLDPATLHDWPDSEAALTELAHQWDSVWRRNY